MKSDDPSRKDTVETPVEGTGPERSQTEEPIISAAGVAETANKAINDAAQKYFAAAGIKVDLEDIQNKIRDRPLFYVAIAAGTGFVIGGAWRQKWGWR
jgi:cob(I)alamin adenosyltransferase